MVEAQAQGKAEDKGTQPPNILFIMADQMRFDAFAAGKKRSGHSGVPPHPVKSWTPALDALAGDGIMFTRAYSSTPTCTPARAALLTGQSPWFHGMLGYGKIARRYPFEMPRALREAGYTTHSFGKDHFDWNETDKKTFEPWRHGYETTDLYEGIVDEMDDYHQWFRQFSTESPEEAGWPTLDMNSWRGKAFALLNESLHPTKYVGDRVVNFLKDKTKRGRPSLPKSPSTVHILHMIPRNDSWIPSRPEIFRPWKSQRVAVGTRCLRRMQSIVASKSQCLVR